MQSLDTKTLNIFPFIKALWHYREVFLHAISQDLISFFLLFYLFLYS